MLLLNTIDSVNEINLAIISNEMNVMAIRNEKELIVNYLRMYYAMDMQELIYVCLHVCA